MKACIIQILIAISLALWLNTTWALDYDVEVVVFERDQSSTDYPDIIDNSIPNLDRKASRIQNITATYQAQKESGAWADIEVNSELSELNAIRRELAGSGYRLLRTASWTQPGNVYQNSPVISLGLDNSTLPRAFIRIYKTTLIFVDLNLRYDTLQAQSGASSTATQNLTTDASTDDIREPQSRFYLSEKRRLKFGEIHYFDHPRFGVILGVWSTAAQAQ